MAGNPYFYGTNKNLYMIRTIRLLLLLVFAGITFTSCEKELSEENGNLPGIGGNGGGNGGGGGSNANCKSCVYQPWCDGMEYTYIDTSGSGSVSTANQTLDLLSDTTIDGKSFQKTDAGSGSEITYHNCTNGVTLVVALNATGAGGTQVARLNSTFIKENEPVGTTWQEINTVSGQDAIYDYEIVAKNITHTVLGVDFPDVIHVHQTLSIDLLGTPFPQAETDYYFAKDVGLIEAYTVDAIFGQPQLHRVLQSYHIP